MHGFIRLIFKIIPLPIKDVYLPTHSGTRKRACQPYCISALELWTGKEVNIIHRYILA